MCHCSDTGWNRHRIGVSTQREEKPGEENSPAAPAGIGTRNLSITSSVLYQQAFPASPKLVRTGHRCSCDCSSPYPVSVIGSSFFVFFNRRVGQSFQLLASIRLSSKPLVYLLHLDGPNVAGCLADIVATPINPVMECPSFHSCFDMVTS